MFTLQNQNQALCTLSQFPAILTPRQNAYLSKKNLKRNVQSSNSSSILCLDSFLEAARNLDPLLKKYLKPKLLYEGHFLNKLYYDKPRESWTCIASSSKSKLFNVSYVSYDSFFENKHGFPERYLHSKKKKKEKLLIIVGNRKTISIPFNFYRKLFDSVKHDRPFAFAIQVRNFKTDRSIRAEMDRNPSVFVRIKNAFRFTPESSETQLKNDLLMGQDRFRQIVAPDDQTIPETEKQKLKLAFAEGYLVGSGGNSSQRSGKTSKYLKVVQQVLTIVIFLAIVVSLMASASGSMFRIQLGSQVEVDPEEINVTFEDVKGADEAKQELKDIVEFLKNPDKFANLGGKLPKGVLLVGPPGTGKTLLARAVAGEAGVPFFHAAGPEFDEILVGQGARRVRDLFKAAKERAPCVIFIDEIDSVGAKRTNSVLHPYANQTINQLLSEMDGFHQNEGVIVLGATNRRDDLDQALLRPGRFDVEVTVPTPDYVGRKEILSLYLGKIMAKEVDVELLARGTTGFTGADLENMVNQAALRAAIDGADSVGMKYLESARDKVLMGPERRSRIPDEEANTITAYHEGGHAIVAFFTKDSHPLHKVTIIPRGPSLGHTAYIPEKERYHVTKSQLIAMMDTMMGGRAAEELVFGPEKVTSGASSDLKQATQIATHMVKDWGMSEKVGLRTFPENNKPFVNEVVGPSTTELVDNEIKRILTESYERAKNILKTHSREHKALAEALLKYETLDAEDIKKIMNGGKPKAELKTAATAAAAVTT